MNQKIQPIRFTHDVKKIPEVRPPSALTADSTETGVFLEWNPNLEQNLSGYLVYSIDENGIYRLITENCVTDTHFEDSDTINENEYAYAVTAVNTGVWKARIPMRRVLFIAPNLCL